MAATKGKKTEASADKDIFVGSETEVGEEKKGEPIVAKDVDPTTCVIVRNGYHGKLFYRSSRTGERFVWRDYGDEQEMELRELRNAKNSDKKFFENNWFMFNDAWIIDYLGVRQFYKNAIRIEDYDRLFQKSSTELKRIVGEMTGSQKRSAAYRAAELIKDGKIDSLKTIKTLEDIFGLELIEK